MKAALATAVHSSASPGWPAVRSLGAGYILAQALLHLLFMSESPPPGWLPRDTGLLALGLCVTVVGVVNSRLVGFGSPRGTVACVGTAVFGAAAAYGFLRFVFPGPLIATGWLLGWAAAGSLLVGSRFPAWSRWLAACLTCMLGALVLWMILLGDLIPEAESEGYALAQCIVHPVLMGAGIACYVVNRYLLRHRRSSRRGEPSQAEH